MGAQGTATLDFGAYPGVSVATVAVTGQAGILGSSLVEAWIYPDATADHTEYEHFVVNFRVYVPKSDIVAGTGFTIYGIALADIIADPAYTGAPIQRPTGGNLSGAIPGAQIPDRRTNQAPFVWGRWSIAWAWN